MLEETSKKIKKKNHFIKMSISPTYDSEYWLTHFFSFRYGLFWSFLTSLGTWFYLCFFLTWWILCSIKGTYCISEIPGVNDLSYYFWIFLALWLGYSYTRYREIFESVATSLGRISDIQTQSCAWLPGQDAHDLCRWSCSYLLAYMLECSNIKKDKGVPYNFIRARKLINDNEYLMLKKVKDNNAGSPSFLFISWMQNRAIILSEQGTINYFQFQILSKEITQLRRFGASVGDFQSVMIPWPIHQTANFIATCWLLMIALQYSQERLGIISFLWQLFAVQVTRLIAGRMAHPFRMNIGWDWIHSAPSASIHCFPLIFNKVRGLGNYLRHAQEDIYLKNRFGSYFPDQFTSEYAPFNSQTSLQEMDLALKRHEAKCLKTYGSSHLVDWCYCAGNATKTLNEIPFGRLGGMCVCIWKFINSCLCGAKKDQSYKRFPNLPPEPQPANVYVNQLSPMPIPNFGNVWAENYQVPINIGTNILGPTVHP